MYCSPPEVEYHHNKPIFTFVGAISLWKLWRSTSLASSPNFITHIEKPEKTYENINLAGIATEMKLAEFGHGAKDQTLGAF